MKKTIQINIAGVVFNIEEEAYQTLSNYLSSIQSYFSNYESSEEIVADIEARIAEKFIGKNKTDELPVIGTEDVNRVMASMGTVADFQAIEEEEAETFAQEAPKSTETKEEKTKSPKRLYRDNKRKALAGVLSGLANHFNVDVVWFRVIFLVAALGLIESGVGGIFVLAYIICWIAIPASDELKEQENIKKFYRNGDKKVVAGVASGLASYFGLDVAVIRIIFVVGIVFFGVGLIAYLVLWVASPIAESLTQKMEMKGQAVTIENIDSNIKQKLSDKSSGITPRNESPFATILLLPFRILGKLFQGLGHLLSKLGPVFRVLMGIFLAVMGLSLTVGSIVGTAAFFGLMSDHSWFQSSNDIGLFTRDLDPSAGIFLFLATALPAIGVLISGIFLISNNRIGNRNFWLTGLGLWVLGIVGLAVYGGKYSMNYAKNASVTQKESYTFASDVIYLDINDNYGEDDFDFNSQVRILESYDNQVTLEKRYSASGSTRSVAKTNAEKLIYNVSQKDSLLIFDERARLNPETGFRNQKVHIDLKIPVGQKIHISNAFARNLLSDSWSLKSKYGLRSDDFDALIFTLNSNGKLECEGCEILDDDAKEAVNRRDHYNFNNDDEDFDRLRGENTRVYDFKDFDGIEVGGEFRILIRQGDEYGIEFMAERERDIDDLNVRLDGTELDIDFEDRFFENRGKIVAYITMPTLESLDISGASKIKVLSFENINEMDIDISGASNAKLDIEAKKLRVDGSGASHMEIRGRVDEIDMDLSGASRFEAKRAEVGRAYVDASGASHADFGKVDQLRSNTSGASRVSRD
ncbi:PspC domain-containing protein [Arcticibacterium luteifluviistationis]|uniref:Phage shock protein PspC N-terminal domain-containing protein n=1 Tax=Arcticibacterium luteifluviistationis TaxID=1784714 RepID=A0A2Z4GIK0_9BACT|nr:PspC domain-containing protein [Arcticibacterium luteifluviistationis]AWW00694.1 hypothetical protein DJ013_21895 [Arcticibacterium luteifluviistationis]